MSHEINEKLISTEFGELQYYRSSNLEKQDILFIHGWNLLNNWFPVQYQKYSLNKYRWVVPSLLGYGNSSKPEKIQAYTMNQYAKDLLELLKREAIKNVIIIAHSMGGAIAISLIDLIVQDTTICVSGLLILEGNLDKNDLFATPKVAAKSFKEYQNEYEGGTSVSPLALWTSSVDLVKESESNTLLPRLRKNLNFPVYFIFGEKNKGKYSSEDLVRQAQLPIRYIPNTGHFMHEENPDEFWNVIHKLLESLD